jgi:transcriptional regulator with XRE-family HTH domain
MGIPFKEARQIKDVTQRQIERDTDIEQATLSRGERGFPFSPKTAEKLAIYFGFPWEEKHFLYPDRYMTPEEKAERDSKVEAKAS